MSSFSSMKSMDIDDDSNELEQGFEEHFDPPAPDPYECPICLLVLNKPMQTVCGHRFCKGCILKVLREGRQNCPIDNEVLSEQQIYPDNFARREILNLNVHCHNFKTFNCLWLGPLKDLKNHLENCEFAMVECKSCLSKVPRHELEEHLNNKCQRRIVSCEYCDIKVVFQKLQEHIERCKQYLVICPNGCGVNKIPRCEIEKHIEFECPRTLIKCPYHEVGCFIEANREELDCHVGESESNHLLLCMKALASSRKVNMELMDRVSKLENSESNSEDSYESWNTKDNIIFKVEFEKLHSRLRDLELKVTQSKTLTEMYRNEYKQSKSELENKIEIVKNQLAEQETLFTELNARVWCGKFIWKISNFDSRFKQAKFGDLPAVHSQPFYTGIPGYLMCLRVNLNGIDSGANTHMSMFVHLMQGEFDSVLDWPFPGNITLTVMDQDPFGGEPQHIKETLTARPSLQAFLRPKTARNHKGYGYVEMLPHSTLKERGYVKDDSMIVRVDIKMPPR